MHGPFNQTHQNGDVSVVSPPPPPPPPNKTHALIVDISFVHVVHTVSVEPEVDETILALLNPLTSNSS